MSLNTLNLGLTEKLEDAEYRHEFFKVITQEEIATQIRELREAQGMRQVDLAKVVGMKQSAVSRIEQAEYSRWSYTTLTRLAKALDTRLRIVFQPTKEAVKELRAAERVSNSGSFPVFQLRGNAKTSTSTLAELKGNADESAGNYYWSLREDLASHSSQGQRPGYSTAGANSGSLRILKDASFGSSALGQRSSYL